MDTSHLEIHCMVSQMIQVKKKEVACQTKPLMTDSMGRVSQMLQEKTREVACQTEPLMKLSTGTQMSLMSLEPPNKSKDTGSTRDFATPSSSIQHPCKRPRLELDDVDDGDKDDDDDDGVEEDLACSSGLEVTCDPQDSITTLTEAASTSSRVSPASSTHSMRKYIVFESCLMELFKVCAVCKHACAVETTRRGTFIRIKQLCTSCEYSRRWSSQPLMDNTPAGDLQLTAAVYINGASYIQVHRVFKAMNLQTFQFDTFRRHARLFIEPAIVHVWKNSQDVMLQQLQQKGKVKLGGDMKAGSSGHSGKYGSYTLMDLENNTVVDLQLIQRDEVGGCYPMEKGLGRSLELLKKHDVEVGCIVTDRRPQIQNILRENNIVQYYDVQLVEKGISREVEHISKKKGCQKVKKWMASIAYHLHWTAASSTTGPERVAKWTSLLNHMQDVHTHENPEFPQCLHPIKPTTDKNKWLSPATPAFQLLEKALTKASVLEDVAKLSPHHQMSSLAEFNSVIRMFTPKIEIYTYIGMLCRLFLAALHYNENGNRQQATTSSGEPLFRLSFPKHQKGLCRATPVKTEPTFRYVEDLMTTIVEKVFPDPVAYKTAILKMDIPQDLCSVYALL